MIEIILKILLSYLLGSLMGGLILGKLVGADDIRTVGSKSAGATNALRAHGKVFAAGVFLIDILKGLLAVTVIAFLPWPMVAKQYANWKPRSPRFISRWSIELFESWDYDRPGREANQAGR